MSTLRLAITISNIGNGLYKEKWQLKHNNQPKRDTHDSYHNRMTEQEEQVGVFALLLE